MNADSKARTIGIITFWDCPNFGSFLQAYALQKMIEKMCPNDIVRQMAYSNNRHMDVYYSIARPSMFRHWFIRPQFYLDTLNRLKIRKEIINLRKFKNHYDSYIPHTEKYTADDLKEIYFDTIILGSDIIWDYSIHFFDNDPFLFGYGMKCRSLISYAASFGTVKLGDKHPDYVVASVSKMHGISVRDEKSARIVKEIADREADVVLDPTLLWDFDNDGNIIVPQVNFKYVAVYGSYFTNDQIEWVKEYCKKNDLKIIYLDSGLDKCSWCDVFLEASELSPLEWCGYIKNARMLMTCTFHGFMFGLIFKKKMVFHATDFMKAKLTDFLLSLELYDVLVDQSFRNQIRYHWDYDKIYGVLDKKKEESLAFLEKYIGKRFPLERYVYEE